MAPKARVPQVSKIAARVPAAAALEAAEVVAVHKVGEEWAVDSAAAGSTRPSSAVRNSETW